MVEISLQADWNVKIEGVIEDNSHYERIKQKIQNMVFDENCLKCYTYE